MNLLTKKSVIAVVGATSDVGRRVVSHVQSMDYQVRPISRQHGVSMDDPIALQRALDGASAVYVMIPFDIAAADLHAREDQIGRQLADALNATKPRRVVLLSGLSAHLLKGSSLGAALMEQRLDGLDVPEKIYLRAGFFMENFLKGLAFAPQAETGVFATPFRGDLPMPLVSAEDVSAKVVELLTNVALPPSRVVELHGAADYTFVEATRILGEAIGKPHTQYREVAPADAMTGMIAAGMSQSFAEAVMVTAESFNADERWALEPRSASTSSPTRLETWSRTAFGK
ncbi:MAG TPA: NmrA family NAD(P)-binding protein [Opitutaceae bacterium]|nr:NmrA family NAD(P)-binding protein [Opitutaceae bacterium]